MKIHNVFGTSLRSPYCYWYRPQDFSIKSAISVVFQPFRLVVSAI